MTKTNLLFTNGLTTRVCTISLVHSICREPQITIIVTSFRAIWIECFRCSFVRITNCLGRYIALLKSGNGLHAIRTAWTREDFPVGAWVICEKKINREIYLKCAALYFHWWYQSLKNILTWTPFRSIPIKVVFVGISIYMVSQKDTDNIWNKYIINWFLIRFIITWILNQIE